MPSSTTRSLTASPASIRSQVRRRSSAGYCLGILAPVYQGQIVLWVVHFLGYRSFERDRSFLEPPGQTRTESEPGVCHFLRGDNPVCSTHDRMKRSVEDA